MHGLETRELTCQLDYNDIKGVWQHSPLVMKLNKKDIALGIRSEFANKGYLSRLDCTFRD
ncbi:MAG: hypothetical protein JWP34_4760 [Massilia sp.]|nr:hypothetical protein [Massilia sp.]